jgi:cholesterol oxidase
MGIQFDETAHSDSLDLDLTIVSDNLDELMRNPAHKALVAGRVRATALSAGPLKVVDGQFSLSPIAYRLKLASPEGKTFFLQASKEASAIHATLHDGDSEAGAVRVRSVLRIPPRDLRRQLSALRVSDAANTGTRLQATERFGRALAGDLYRIYGSVGGGRKKRTLRVNAPTIYPLPTAGAAHRWLVRYEGGSHGPILLAPGAGVSSLIFSIDTIETNLIEFLFAQSYDVWLLDSADAADREAAIARVKETAHAANVHVLSAGWESAEPVELNAATREAVPNEWRGISIIGKNAAKDVYPKLLSRLRE